MKEITSYEKLQKELGQHTKSFLLIYKKGSEQSDCAYRNISSASDNYDLGLFVVDVNETRDIHTQYQVSSVPTLLEFDKTKYLKSIKGCHDESFFKSVMNNSLYSASHKSGDDKKAKRVIVYTTPTCPHCTTLKNYLKDNKINFRDMDVSKDQQMAQQMVKKSGQQGVPQIEINGRVVVGFNKPKIDELLELR